MFDRNPQSSLSWRYWTLHQWSEAFFRHFFEFTDEDTPVTRLVITDATWHTVTGDVTGDASASPDEMRRAFLGKFPRSRYELDRHLSSLAIRFPGKKVMQRDLHDFFPYLILTCLVAAEYDAEAGQFPIRLYELLGMQGVGYSPLPFDGLGKVWEELANRLRAECKQGRPWRELVLPDPGIEVRIGYSKRLAFPSRNDQQQLAPLLNSLDRSKWLDEPPIYPVLSIIESRLCNFSTAFREEFRDFKQSVATGQETTTHPLWSVVLGVLRANSQRNQATAPRPALDLLLLMEFDEFDEPILSLLSKVASPWSSITNQPLNFEIAGYDRLLVEDEDPGKPVRRLLNGELHLPDVRSSLLDVVRDGLLIFQRVDGYRVARTRPPEPGPTIVLIRQDLKNAFVNTLGAPAANHPLKLYPNTRWYQFDGLDGQHILSCLANRSIRCLIRIVRSASIGIHEGIRCKEGGYLSRFAALPEFRSEGSQRLRLNHLTAPASAVTLTLNQSETGWRLTDCSETRAGIEGEFEVVAENKSGTRFGARRVRFQRCVLGWDYPALMEPSNWEIEAGLRDAASLVADDRPCWDIGMAWDPEHCVETAVPLPPNEPDRGWCHTGLGDFMEGLAAIGTTRTLGLAEMEFLELLRRFLHIGENDYRLIWDIARAWTEAGLLQRVSDRRWRSVRYLPQIPRLCVSRTEDGTWRGVVLGLMPESLRDRLANTAKILGIVVQWVASASPWLPPGLVLTADNPDKLRNFARAQGLETVTVRPLTDVLASLDQTLHTDDPPGNYSPHAAWDWERSRFQKFTDETPAVDKPSVFWYRRERGDRRDYFVAREESGRILWSYSRVWSLLAGARWLKREIYSYQPGKGLMRHSTGGIHLPIVVGRMAFALSGSAPGPIKEADGNIIYRYPLFDSAQVEWVGTQLLGWVCPNREQPQIPDWLRALMLARSQVEPSLFLSADSKLATISVPVSLVPVYRHLMSFSSK